MELSVLTLLLLFSWCIVESFQTGDVNQNNGCSVKDGKSVCKKDGGFASGNINLGGLEVSQISTFRKIWATHEGGAGNAGATFYEPWPVPDGSFMLGCYAQANNKALSGWVLVARDNANDASGGALKKPLDYTPVWNSTSLNQKKDGDGYFWLPNPPAGYNAVGLVLTASRDKPPLDKVRCVRSDLVEDSEQDVWIWGSNKISNYSDVSVYGLRPAIRGTSALGLQVGTFVVQKDRAVKPISLPCLKNVINNLSMMPNRTEIDALVQEYSPKIYFHPDESYLPSSVNWFFNKGVLLYQKGNEPNPVLVETNGLNLPQGGTDDATYWLDLPVEKGTKDVTKKGDLQSSTVYLHIKPMLGATVTDISIWVFYPFNGSSRMKVKLINIAFKKLGEHVGDWEHVTLRVNNFNGKLWRVYFSQHNKGTWVDASELEYEGGSKFVVYASLHGHAFYPRPGLVLQGDTKLGIGLRNDAAKSNTVMDTSTVYEVVSAGYLGNVVEPPWLNYFRKWGPNISYDTAKELRVVDRITPGNLNNIIPKEALGEAGPTGPKEKRNWIGDEIV